MPWTRNSSTTSQGNSADLSISAARGAICSRTRERTSSRISRCSTVSGSCGTGFSLVPVCRYMVHGCLADGSHRGRLRRDRAACRAVLLRRALSLGGSTPLDSLRDPRERAHPHAGRTDSARNGRLRSPATASRAASAFTRPRSPRPRSSISAAGWSFRASPTHTCTSPPGRSRKRTWPSMGVPRSRRHSSGVAAGPRRPGDVIRGYGWRSGDWVDADRADRRAARRGDRERHRRR